MRGDWSVKSFAGLVEFELRFIAGYVTTIFSERPLSELYAIAYNMIFKGLAIWYIVPFGKIIDPIYWMYKYIYIHIYMYVCMYVWQI